VWVVIVSIRGVVVVVVVVVVGGTGEIGLEVGEELG
jgi:hypothetical protein